MPGVHWTQQEELDARTMDYDQWSAIHGTSRSRDAYRVKKASMTTVAPAFPDKADGVFDWRQANRVIRDMQGIGKRASYSQDTARIELDVDHPIGIIFLSDAHLGDWATDHELFERITDEILSTPNLYIALLGDMAAMNIKLRGVAEVAANLLPPTLQLEYFASWLDEVDHRIILSTWDNHAVEREEGATGISSFARAQNRRVPYFSGIGHADIVVGAEEYRLAVSHRFRGRSVVNPCAGPMKYLINEAYDREIAAMGDAHVSGVLQFTHGASQKIAINTGSCQLNSGYARRYFSLTTHAVFPVLELHPDRHLAVPYWSVGAWQASRA
jgi:hypothetical protein